MAPAAASTIVGILKDLKADLGDFDKIVTGDLGHVGSDILLEYLKRENALDISALHEDCGKLIFEREAQDVHGGGSGAGCSASMLCSHYLGALAEGKLKRILFVQKHTGNRPRCGLRNSSLNRRADTIRPPSQQ